MKATNLQEYLDKIQRFSLRERVLGLVVVLALVFLVWDVLVGDGLSTSLQQVLDQQNTIATQMHEMVQKTQDFLASGEKEAAVELFNKKSALQEESKRLQQQFHSLNDFLVSPEKMVGVLKDMLKKETHLKLTRVEIQPVESLQQSADRILFKHPVLLELEGGYSDTLHYLQALEKLDGHFYWDGLYYQVLSYPKAKITIQMHMLSEQAEAIGV